MVECGGCGVDVLMVFVVVVVRYCYKVVMVVSCYMWLLVLLVVVFQGLRSSGSVVMQW